MLKPNDNYREYSCLSYHTVDELLDHMYPGDVDVEVFPGVLKDNFIGYQPQLTYVSFKHPDLNVIKDSQQRRYDYIVVAEQAVNEWTSEQVIVLTSDEKYVNEMRCRFEGK